MPTYDTLDFHVDIGPESLFQRVRFKFHTPTRLKGRTPYRDPKYGSDLQAALLNFNASDWDLRIVQVRNDSGKFVTTIWRRAFGEECWWIVLGYEGVIQSLFQVEGSETGITDKTVRPGQVFDFVAKVNDDLMIADGQPSSLTIVPTNKDRAHIAFDGGVPDFFFIGLPERSKTPRHTPQ